VPGRRMIPEMECGSMRRRIILAKSIIANPYLTCHFSEIVPPLNCEGPRGVLCRLVIGTEWLSRLFWQMQAEL
jgi:hypothetical protein